MKKKRFTRKPTYLFTDLRKQPCPPGHFQHEDDLYHAYVEGRTDASSGAKLS